MKFLHTADWHIGKRLHEYPLVKEQQDALDQIAQIAQKEQVDAVVVAGDLYDRSLPSEEAVTLVNQALKNLNLKADLPLLAISGNHDSAVRLATGQEWFKQTKLYLHIKLAEAFTPIEFADTQFFLLPYFELQEARNYFADESLSDLTSAMKLIVAKLKTKFDPTKKQVLVAHFFAAGSLRSDSETKIEVGGLDSVPPELFSDFDHVALGHLHDKRALDLPTVKYSGSLLKYSVAEANSQKGVWIVETEPFSCKWIPLDPLNDIRRLEASYAELTTKLYQTVAEDDYVAIELTDEHEIIDVMNKLRKYYPRIVELKRKKRLVHTKQAEKIESKTPLELFTDFFVQATGQEPTQLQQKWAKESLLALKRKVSRDATIRIKTQKFWSLCG